MQGIVKYISFTSIIIFFLLFITLIAFAHSPQIENGIAYLSSIQSPAGSWGITSSSTNNEYLSTSEVLFSLNRLGLANMPAYQNGLLWIQSREDKNTAYLVKKIEILSNSGIDQTIDVSVLSSYRNLDGGWGGYQNVPSGNYHTTLALRTLKAANYSDQSIVYSAISYLTNTQNADGGWGFYQGDDSNVYVTAIVLNTLSQFKSTYDLKTPINNAVTYLLAHQNPDGSFGEGTVYETALSFIALIASDAVGADKAANMQNAINYLTVTQLPNGSWEDDPYSTALALRALAHVKPNLSISSTDITFSTPTAGGTVTITANIKNAGTTQADNILSNSVMENNRKKSS